MTEPTNVSDLPGGVDRREFIQTSAAAAALLAFGDRPRFPFALDDRALVYAEIPKQHDATVKMLQEWIALPSIAAEDRNYPAGRGVHGQARCATRDVRRVELVPTKGKPGVFAHARLGGRRPGSAIYFMYDVKQFDPAEWSSPPLEGAARRQAGHGQDHRRARRHEFQGTAGRLPRRAPRVQGRRQEAAGQHRPRVRRGGGDRVAELPRRSSSRPRSRPRSGSARA